MPRGRFVSKSFYDNDRLNNMPIEAHHLFGGLIIVCADVDGRSICVLFITPPCA